MGGHGGHKEVYRMNIPKVQKETGGERGARPLPAYNLKHKVTNLGRGGWLISCDDRWGAVVTRLSEAVESGSARGGCRGRAAPGHRVPSRPPARPATLRGSRPDDPEIPSRVLLTPII